VRKRRSQQRKETAFFPTKKKNNRIKKKSNLDGDYDSKTARASAITSHVALI